MSQSHSTQMINPEHIIISCVEDLNRDPALQIVSGADTKAAEETHC